MIVRWVAWGFWIFSLATSFALIVLFSYTSKFLASVLCQGEETFGCGILLALFIFTITHLGFLSIWITLARRKTLRHVMIWCLLGIAMQIIVYIVLLIAVLLIASSLRLGTSVAWNEILRSNGWLFPVAYGVIELVFVALFLTLNKFFRKKNIAFVLASTWGIFIGVSIGLLFFAGRIVYVGN